MHKTQKYTPSSLQGKNFDYEFFTCSYIFMAIF